MEKDSNIMIANNYTFQIKKPKSKYLIIIFLSLMILGSGYNIKINDIHEKETKSTLHSTNRAINELLEGSGIANQNANYFYSGVDFQPMWTVGFQQNHYAETLESILFNAHYFGIGKNAEIEEELNALKEKMLTTKSLDKLSKIRAEYEIKLSDAAISTLIQLDKGILFFDTLKDGKVINGYADYLLKSVQSDNFEETFLAVQPSNKTYVELLEGLKLFLERATLSKVRPEIDVDNMDSTKKVATTVFYELGYISSNLDLDSSSFVNALKTFQMHHGIKQSGVICNKTVSALEMSSDERYKQILLNIERARSEGFNEETFVYVNIPAYSLKLFQNGELSAQHRVIVGKPESQTPVLSSKMEVMVANPKWYVPKSISRGEILYKLRKDSTYLETRNFVLLDKDHKTLKQTDIDWNEVDYKNFNYRIYQEPGSGNSLGKIKFLFPNEFSVYVHDTQSKRLFNKDYRAYSHGCIRLENPLDFADHLLTRIDIENFYKTVKPIVKSEKTKEIKFDQPIDIHIRYYTCEVDENNLMYFYQDIYEKDAILKEQLFTN